MSNVLAFDKFLDAFKNKAPEEPKVRYPTVPESDWPALDVIQPNLKDGPWIAGGACLRWYQGQPVNMSDIDVFFRDAFQLRRAMNRIEDTKRFYVRHRSDNAITYEYSTTRESTADDYKSFTIQLIQHKYFNSIEDVIDRFDFSVCQVATCGDEWILGEHTARDIRSRSLRAVGDVKDDIVKRVAKYWVYGYRPVTGLITEITNRPGIKYKFTQDEDYNNAF
jgi:hypothetical protein